MYTAFNVTDVNSTNTQTHKLTTLIHDSIFKFEQLWLTMYMHVFQDTF